MSGTWAEKIEKAGGWSSSGFLFSMWFVLTIFPYFVVRLPGFLMWWPRAPRASIPSSVQFSRSVVSDSLWPMNRSTPGLPVHHQLPESTQTHLHWFGDAIQPSHPLSSLFSSCSQSLPASEAFPMSQLFAWGGQSIGVTALASVLPMNTQDWSP